MIITLAAMKRFVCGRNKHLSKKLPLLLRVASFFENHEFLYRLETHHEWLTSVYEMGLRKERRLLPLICSFLYMIHGASIEYSFHFVYSLLQ